MASDEERLKRSDPIVSYVGYVAEKVDAQEHGLPFRNRRVNPFERRDRRPQDVRSSLLGKVYRAKINSEQHFVDQIEAAAQAVEEKLGVEVGNKVRQEMVAKFDDRTFSREDLLRMVDTLANEVLDGKLGERELGGSAIIW